MALNRRQRRARTTRRPNAGDSPKQQMRDFLNQPGKFHIVELPDEKSFVVKVTEREMPLFLTICGQLKGVLGHCEVTPATPVDATLADAATQVRDSAGDPYRIKLAQDRTDAAEAKGDNGGGDSTTNVTPPERFDNPELDAALARHPAGKKRRGGRHAKDEPDTVFEQLTRGAAAADESEGRARLASIELAAAQAESARASEALDAANARLAEVYARTGEIHNQRVLDGFTDAAGQALADKAEAWSGDGPYIEYRAEDGPGSTPIYPQYDITGPGKFTVDDAPTGYSAPEVFAPRTDGNYHQMTCSRSRDTCDWSSTSLNAAEMLNEYTAHIAEHAKAEALEADDGEQDNAIIEHRVQCPRTGCRWAAVSAEITEAAADYANHLADHIHQDMTARAVAAENVPHVVTDNPQG